MACDHNIGFDCLSSACVKGEALLGLDKTKLISRLVLRQKGKIYWPINWRIRSITGFWHTGYLDKKL